MFGRGPGIYCTFEHGGGWCFERNWSAHTPSTLPRSACLFFQWVTKQPKPLVKDLSGKCILRLCRAPSGFCLSMITGFTLRTQPLFKYTTC